MVSVQKISFKADSTNLLRNYTSQPLSTSNKSFEPVKNKSELPVSSDTVTQTEYHKNMKYPLYASAVATVLTLSMATAMAVKNRNLSKQIEFMKKENGELIEQLSSKLSKKVDGVKDSLAEKLSAGIKEAFGIVEKDIKKIDNKIEEGIKKSSEEIANGLKASDKKISDLGVAQGKQIDGLRAEFNSKVGEVRTTVSSAGMSDINLSPVFVNNLKLDLATSLHGYGKNTAQLEKTLRSESSKRILGAVDRSAIIPKDVVTIRIPTSEYKGFSSTGGMSIVPKEVVANLGAIVNGKQNIRMIVDTPLYLGQIEESMFYSLEKTENGLYNYISSKSAEPLVKGLQKIDTMRLPIYTDKGKTIETVDVYLAKNLEQAVDLELLKPWLEKDLLAELETSLKSGNSFEISKNAVTIKYSPEKGDLRPTARVKYDAVFYKSDKFNMDGPVFDGQAKNIYDNKTVESGETERFIYFDKFFYEHLLRSHESSTDKLGADLIIGNDWQTGAISAMVRLLTPAKKAFGLDPRLADKIYDTPIITLMHNAGLAGDVSHSQSKLLNIMFGEHSAMVTQNAWMPRNAAFKFDELNGLFHGDNFNPQTMAAVYSDILTPVSKGYAHEIASHSGFGGANHEIFRMRARYNEFSDVEHLKYIARQNDLPFETINQVNMAYRPITNGSDKVNNTLMPSSAVSLQKIFNLPEGSLKILEPKGNVTGWHFHNKEVYLNKVIEELNMARAGVGNPMNIALPQLTNLEGVTKNTMVVSTAGRIVDQKGLDIFAESIEEFLSRHVGEESPVFYVQGIGDQKYIDKLLDVKKRIATKYGEKAANRIVYAKVFSEPGRYDGCKLMSDFTVMSSWFEPCGLVHKEIAAYSGSIPIVNKVGGLTDGLKDGVNAIFAEFTPKFKGYEYALMSNKKSFADALDKAYELFKDKSRFSQVLNSSFNADHSWLKPDGPIQEYAKMLVDLKVLKPEVLVHS